MTSPTSNNLYPVANAISSSKTFVDIFLPRDPTFNDNQYQLQQKWLNTTNGNFWILEAFTSTATTLLPKWVRIGSPSLVETLTGNSGGAVGVDSNNNINTVGDNVGIVVTGSPSTNTLTWSLKGGGQAIQGVIPDAHTSPGTSPVVPNVSGNITVTGAQVAAGTTANVIRTNSLAANTYTIEVQRSKNAASSTVGDNGVAHFDSAAFPVDSNAFVQFPTIDAQTGSAYPSSQIFSIVGSGGITTSASGSTVTIAGSAIFGSVNIQTFTTSGTYTPTSGMLYCIVEVLGGGGAGGGATTTSGSQVSVGGGGGAGEYARGFFSSSTIGASQTVTIGAGGAGNSGSAGSNGGNTSLGALMSANGGSGGSTGTTTTGITVAAGGGGTGGSGGSLRTPGAPGDIGIGQPSPLLVTGGKGGTPLYGSPGGPTPGQGAGSAAAGYGAGGGAGGNNQSAGAAQTGGAGSAGIVIVTEYIG